MPNAAGSDATHEIEEGCLVRFFSGARRPREVPAHQLGAPTRRGFGELRRVSEVERVEHEAQDALRFHDLNMALGLRRIEVHDQLADIG